MGSETMGKITNGRERMGQEDNVHCLRGEMFRWGGETSKGQSILIDLVFTVAKVAL